MYVRIWGTRNNTLVSSKHSKVLSTKDSNISSFILVDTAEYILVELAYMPPIFPLVLPEVRTRINFFVLEYHLLAPMLAIAHNQVCNSISPVLFDARFISQQHTPW